VYLNVHTHIYGVVSGVPCCFVLPENGSRRQSVVISGSDPEARELKMNEGPEIWDV